MGKNQQIEDVENNPRLQEAFAKGRRIEAQLAAVDAEIAAFCADQEPQKNRLESLAAQVASGGELTDTLSPVPVSPALQTLYDRRRVLRRARELSQGEVARLRNELGVALADSRRPAYACLVVDLARAAASFTRAAAQEYEFRRRVIDAGGRISHWPAMVWQRSFDFDRREESSLINRFARELVEAGYLSKKEVSELFG